MDSTIFYDGGNKIFLCLKKAMCELLKSLHIAECAGKIAYFWRLVNGPIEDKYKKFV